MSGFIQGHMRESDNNENGIAGKYFKNITENPNNYENMTINDLISDYIIYKIENPNFDFLKIKYWKIFNGKNIDSENSHILQK